MTGILPEASKGGRLRNAIFHDTTSPKSFSLIQSIIENIVRASGSIVQSELT